MKSGNSFFPKHDNFDQCKVKSETKCLFLTFLCRSSAILARTPLSETGLRNLMRIEFHYYAEIYAFGNTMVFGNTMSGHTKRNDPMAMLDFKIYLKIT